MLTAESLARWRCSASVRAPVVHGDRAAAERLRRDQLEPSRAGQPALVQGRAVAGDPGVDEEPVLVDQIQPIQLGRELAATEEHAGWGGVLELLHTRAKVAGEVVAVGPREVLSRRRHHVLRLGIQLDRPLAHRRRRLLVAAGDRRPVALHHLVGDAAPQHRPALVHEAGEEGVCLVVGDSLLVVDAAVQGDVDAEGQESHGVLRSRYATRRSAVWLQPIAASFRWRMIGAESASSGSATRCATIMRVPRAVATSSTVIPMCAPTGHSGIIALTVGRSFESTNVNDRRVGATTSSNTPRIETSCPSGQRCSNRITPPGRASIPQRGTSTLSGANQRAKCSALVHASKTSSGGAAYSRSSIRSALAATRMAPSGGLLQL